LPAVVTTNCLFQNFQFTVTLLLHVQARERKGLHMLSDESRPFHDICQELRALTSVNQLQFEISPRKSNQNTKTNYRFGTIATCTSIRFSRYNNNILRLPTLNIFDKACLQNTTSSKRVSVLFLQLRAMLGARFRHRAPEVHFIRSELGLL
jgi:hypothetical protein